MGDQDLFRASDHDLTTAAGVFRHVAQDLDAVLDGAADDLTVKPWLGEREPVSLWAAEQFTRHLEQFRERLTELSGQHRQFADSLTQARDAYVAADHLDA